MQIINLLTTAEKDVRWLTKKHCDGKYSLWQRLKKGGTGFGGLYYLGGIEEIDANQRALDPFRANMEVFRNGFGVYLRNGQENHLILLQPEDLPMLTLEKAPPRPLPDFDQYQHTVKILGITYYKFKGEKMLYRKNVARPIRLFLHLSSGEKAGFEFINFAEKRIYRAVRSVFGSLLKQ